MITSAWIADVAGVSTEQEKWLKWLHISIDGVLLNITSSDDKNGEIIFLCLPFQKNHWITDSMSHQIQNREAGVTSQLLSVGCVNYWDVWATDSHGKHTRRITIAHKSDNLLASSTESLDSIQ